MSGGRNAHMHIQHGQFPHCLVSLVHFPLQGLMTTLFPLQRQVASVCHANCLREFPFESTIDISQGLCFSCWIRRRLDLRLLRFFRFWLSRKCLMLFFELECLTSLDIPYTPRIALTPSKQTEWISSIIISKIGSAKYQHSTELPEAHLYWIPSSSPLLDSQ